MSQVPEPSSLPPPIPQHSPFPFAPGPQYSSISEPPPPNLEPDPEPEPEPISRPVAVLPPDAYALPPASFVMDAKPTSAAEDQGTFQFPGPAALDQQHPPIVGVKGPAKLTKENPQSWGQRHDSLLSSGPSPPPFEDVSPTERPTRLQRPGQLPGSSSSSQPSDNGDSRVSSPTDGAMPPGDTKVPPANTSPPRKVEKLRRNFLTGGKSRANSLEQGSPAAEAWILSPDKSNAEYNLSLLVESEKVRCI